MEDKGACQTKNRSEDEDTEDVPPPALDESDIELLKSYGLGPYTTTIKATEKDISDLQVLMIRLFN